MSNDTIPLKRCTKCGNEYPATLEYFYKHRNGLTAQCKSCVRDYQQSRKEPIAEYHRARYLRVRDRVREYRQRNKERITAKNRERYRRNFERIAEQKREYANRTKERTVEYSRQWREENQDTLRVKKRLYAQRNKERIAEHQRDYYLQNRSRYIAASKRRKARKRGLPNRWTAQDWQRCLDYWYDCCAVCGTQLVETHADHFIPLSYKGNDNPGTVPTNMLCLCSECNLNKGRKLPEKWLLERYGVDEASAILKRIQDYFDSL